MYFEKCWRMKNQELRERFGVYACTAQNAMDHEIILTRSLKQNENESESVILVFVLHHFHSDSRSLSVVFFGSSQSKTPIKSL